MFSGHSGGRKSLYEKVGFYPFYSQWEQPNLFILWVISQKLHMADGFKRHNTHSGEPLQEGEYFPSLISWTKSLNSTCFNSGSKGIQPKSSSNIVKFSDPLQAMDILLQPLLFSLCRRQFTKCCLGSDVYCVYLSACSKSSLAPQPDVHCRFLGSRSQMPTV